MLGQHWVRVGVVGEVGRYTASDGSRYARGSRVVLRTRRGLEVGDVLSSIDDPVAYADGVLLRRVSVEDELLLARLDRNKSEALDVCQSWLERQGMPATLLDAEPMLDGSRVFFHFLGEVPAGFDILSDALTDEFRRATGIDKFAETLEHGCGPGCGTDDAENGCKTGSCGTCAVLHACSTKKK